MSIRTIAVFAPNLIGDTVMATPTFRALREHFDEARISLVVRSNVAPVLDGAPWFDQVIKFDRRSATRGERTLGLCAHLRREKPDVAILLPNSVRSALMAWTGGCRRRVGFDRGDRGLLLTDRLTPARDGRGRWIPTPAVESYLEIARRMGCQVTSRNTELFTTMADERAADIAWERLGLPAGGRVVCLNTGGAYGPAKNWPNSHFVSVARELTSNHDAHVLVLCGPAERDSARAIVAESADPRVVSLADEPLGIGLSKVCVRRSSLLITTDSGPRHFAAAFGVPEITLFGPTHIEWTRTVHPLALYLQIAVDCGPCQRPVCSQGHHRCMRDLMPDAVLAAVRQIFATPGERAA